jgi:phage terminase Nu1 subunit (DNA packaging protein)
MKRKIVTAKEMAVALDLSLRRLRELGQHKILVRVGFNKYDRSASITAYIKHLKKLAAERAGQNDPARDVARANAHMREAQAALLRARFERESAKLISRDDAVALWSRIISGSRRLLFALPDKIAAAVPELSETDVSRIRQLVSDGYTDARMQDGYSFDCAASADTANDGGDDDSAGSS